MRQMPCSDYPFVQAVDSQYTGHLSDSAPGIRKTLPLGAARRAGWHEGLW